MPDLSNALEQLGRKGRVRPRPIVHDVHGSRLQVDGKPVISFCGTDYLGLGQDARVAQIVARAAARYGVGAGPTPFEGGHRHVHERLEQALAAFLGVERALLFPSVALAHDAVLSALAAKGDGLFCDEGNVPTLNDPAFRSGARIEVYSHGDMTHLEFAMESAIARKQLIVTHGVFPYLGDRANLSRIMTLTQRHDAWLVVEDSHGFGLIGERGQGSLSEHGQPPRNALIIASLAHAMGGSGAFVAGGAQALEWIMQTSPHYQDNPTLSPALVAGMIAALPYLEEAHSAREHLRKLGAALGLGLRQAGFALPDTACALHGLVLRDRAAAIKMQDALMQRQLWVPIVTYTSQATAVLRIALTTQHSLDDVNRLVQALCALRETSVSVTVP